MRIRHATQTVTLEPGDDAERWLGPGICSGGYYQTDRGPKAGGVKTMYKIQGVSAEVLRKIHKNRIRKQGAEARRRRILRKARGGKELTNVIANLRVTTRRSGSVRQELSLTFIDTNGPHTTSVVMSYNRETQVFTTGSGSQYVIGTTSDDIGRDYGGKFDYLESNGLILRDEKGRICTETRKSMSSASWCTRRVGWSSSTRSYALRRRCMGCRRPRSSGLARGSIHADSVRVTVEGHKNDHLTPTHAFK